jgi:SAM-dependent methyltransferase
MAERPLLPPLNEASRAALADHAAGRASAEVTLMRLMLSGMPAATVPALVRDSPALAALARRHAEGLVTLERMVRAGADHAKGTDLAATRAMFDRLVALSPEASVAAYSLGDPATLAAATKELVEWLRGLGLLAGQPRVLDLGCGIGRVAAAVAPQAASVLGLDVSERMVAEARARHADLPRLRFETCSWLDLAGVEDAGFDLVLAVDVFPYLVQAGRELAAGMLAEAARVLRPGGQLVILNHAYGDAGGEDLAADARDCGLIVLEAGSRPLSLWDAMAFRLLRGLAGRHAL